MDHHSDRFQQIILLTATFRKVLPGGWVICFCCPWILSKSSGANMSNQLIFKGGYPEFIRKISTRKNTMTIITVRMLKETYGY
jgi:hypothetical protein